METSVGVLHWQLIQLTVFVCPLINMQNLTVRFTRRYFFGSKSPFYMSTSIFAAASVGIHCILSMIGRVVAVSIICLTSHWAVYHWLIEPSLLISAAGF